MLLIANKKDRKNLKFINEYIDYLEDIKESNKYGEWTVDDEINLENMKVAKAEYENEIQKDRESYLKKIIFNSKVICACALGGALAYIVTKDNKS